MGLCSITSITHPSSSTSVVEGSSMTVTWNPSNIFDCADWNVSTVKLQSNASGSWVDISTVFSGSPDPVNSGSLNITIPTGLANYGDYYRLKVTYEEVEEEG